MNFPFSKNVSDDRKNVRRSFFKEIGWGQICGGAIISATRTLTAAHCTEWFPEYPLEVQAGSNSINAGGQRILVASKVDHPQYDDWTLENDISILYLAGALNVALPGIAAIAMPPQGAGTAVGTSARVAGWGALYEGHGGVDYLRYVYVPVVSNAECNALYGGGITGGMLCAGFPEGNFTTFWTRVVSALELNFFISIV